MWSDLCQDDTSLTSGITAKKLCPVSTSHDDRCGASHAARIVLLALLIGAKPAHSNDSFRGTGVDSGRRAGFVRESRKDSHWLHKRLRTVPIARSFRLDAKNKMLEPAIAVQNPEPRTGRNYHLDAIRGVAALVVVFDHLHQGYFVLYRNAAPGVLRILYLEHYFAGSAVMMFFALSGYLVGGSALRALGRRRWSWGNCLLNRATRLYVALIPALILTAILDHLARTHGGMNMGYAPQSMKDFWGSVFFLQGIYTQPDGSNGPLWSLSYQFSVPHPVSC